MEEESTRGMGEGESGGVMRRKIWKKRRKKS